jgi:hypothetical protein
MGHQLAAEPLALEGGRHGDVLDQQVIGSRIVSISAAS